jgi:hypothetical protein
MQKLFYFLPFLLLPFITLAQEAGNFIPLVGIPYVETDVANRTLGDYVNALYIAAISIAAVLAVLRIIYAGVQYMLSDIVTQKGEAKKTIRNALLGLILIVAAFLILETINPQLTSLNSLDQLEGLNVTLERDVTPPSAAPSTSTGDGLDSFDATGKTEDEITSALTALREKCGEVGDVIKIGDTYTCRGAVAPSSEDNFVNTINKFNSLTTSLPPEEKQNLATRYNQYIGPQEPDGLTEAVLEDIKNELNLETTENIIFIVNTLSSGTFDNLAYTQYEGICNDLAGSIGSQLTTSNSTGHTICAIP